MAVNDGKKQKSITLPKEILLIINAIAAADERTSAWVTSKIVIDYFNNLDNYKKNIYRNYVKKYVTETCHTGIESERELLTYESSALDLLECEK